MTKEEIIQAIFDDKMMPFIQPEQLAQIVEFVINNYRPSLPADLDDAAEEHANRCYTRSASGERIAACKYDFIAGAEYQRKQDQSLIELAEDHAMLAGMNKMKEEMMEKAVEIEVKEDAGGFPIVPLDAIELYDYENDKPLAKAGDKVKVIVIKEEEL